MAENPKISVAVPPAWSRAAIMKGEPASALSNLLGSRFPAYDISTGGITQDSETVSIFQMFEATGEPDPNDLLPNTELDAIEEVVTEYYRMFFRTPR
ncbi:hypothetical protein [Devosia sp. 1635]|uniref:hypothetical protein n=1 Tax=Devosia sp. 1635 TaxID=2726066 RepID=UPI0015657635|nr:hypothetical protein [Devosia sp. 1635]